MLMENWFDIAGKNGDAILPSAPVCYFYFIYTGLIV